MTKIENIIPYLDTIFRFERTCLTSFFIFDNKRNNHQKEYHRLQLICYFFHKTASLNTNYFKNNDNFIDPDGGGHVKKHILNTIYFKEMFPFMLFAYNS